MYVIEICKDTYTLIKPKTKNLSKNVVQQLLMRLNAPTLQNFKIYIASFPNGNFQVGEWGWGAKFECFLRNLVKMQDISELAT